MGLEDAGDAEEIGCVAVVAAGVHDARRLRTVRALVLFRQGQSINIGAQEQNRTGQGTANEARYACFGNGAHVFNTGFMQFFYNALARVILFAA